MNYETHAHLSVFLKKIIAYLLNLLHKIVIRIGLQKD